MYACNKILLSQIQMRQSKRRAMTVHAIHLTRCLTSCLRPIIATSRGYFILTDTTISDTVKTNMAIFGSFCHHLTWDSHDTQDVTGRRSQVYWLSVPCPVCTSCLYTGLVILMKPIVAPFIRLCCFCVRLLDIGLTGLGCSSGTWTCKPDQAFSELHGKACEQPQYTLDNFLVAWS